mmetsp:Transcript_12998/g.19125  ORF Transcript_12998/g.19125 Transcript_12998/m.19125 type:complete len:1140 (+) Transcript_12998:154-3573(+)
MSQRGTERFDYPNQNPMMRINRSNSSEGNERMYNSHSNNNMYHQQQQPPPKQAYGYRGMPPTYPSRRSDRAYRSSSSFTPTYRGPSHNSSRLQSVVTSSFSLEDEREDVAGPRGYYSNQRLPDEHRHPTEPTRQGEEREMAARDDYNREGAPGPPSHMYDGRAPPSNMQKPIRIPPSPGDSIQDEILTVVGSPKVSPEGPLKRSFWHHARSDGGVQQHPPSMHPAFVPPKRAKVGTGRKEREVVMIPRSHGENGDYGQSRGNSWSGPEEDPRYPSQYSWNRQHSSSFGNYPEEFEEPNTYGRSWSMEESSRNGAFRSVGRGPRLYQTNSSISPQGSFPSPRPPPPSQWASSSRMDSYEWSPSSQDQWHRDDVESMRGRSYSRDMSWEDRDNRQVTFDHGGPYRHYDYYGSNRGAPPQVPPRSILRRNNSMVDDIHQSSMHRDGPRMFLGQPEDRISLSETLCTIRENIEVFTATKADVEAPAPGRKHPVVVGQVGLRCIHCRHTTKSSDRVKRAVCYPSSIKRIYRTVIDMKLDHFAHCRFVPKALKDRLDELKAINTRSTGTTMQYFVRAAAKMGMVDSSTGSGVRLQGPKTEDTESASSPVKKEEGSKAEDAPKSPSTPEKSPERKDSIDDVAKSHSSSSPGSEKKLVRTPSDTSDLSIPSQPSDCSSVVGSTVEEPAETFMGKVALAVPEDKMALSPLRCFLRKNVYAFTASEEDIAVRTPTTFSVVVGQVGIGCVHCHSLPAKERSNRAVCFPFAINRIYQSVADIQRFHLAECKMVPPAIREQFKSLQSQSSKGSKGLATRQYWVTSAKKIGLVDTNKGIRYGRDPSIPATQAVSLDILAQVASKVTTVNKPLVLPEDKPFIAEFLYEVMEQLQPCRFTEADRNKRRLKDVGCIGVECKHCAGQVESRKFFWSSVNAVESNFVSVHTHMLECKMVPPDLKENLMELKKLRKEQTARLKTGSQKAFFQRVWSRLHDGGKKEEGTDSHQSDEENENKQAQQDLSMEPSPDTKKTVTEGELPIAKESPTGGDSPMDEEPMERDLSSPIAEESPVAKESAMSEEAEEDIVEKTPSSPSSPVPTSPMAEEEQEDSVEKNPSPPDANSSSPTSSPPVSSTPSSPVEKMSEDIEKMAVISV